MFNRHWMPFSLLLGLMGLMSIMACSSAVRIRREALDNSQRAPESKGILDRYKHPWKTRISGRIGYKGGYSACLLLDVGK